MRDDAAVEQCGEERRRVFVGGDQRTGHARRGRVEGRNVRPAAVHDLVAVRERRAQPVVTGRGEVGIEQSQRQDDPARHLLRGRSSGHRLDQQTRDDVVRVGVLDRRARRKLGGPASAASEELIRADRPGGDGRVGVEVLRQATLVAQQLTDRDGARVDAIAMDAAGQVRLDRRIEIDLALRDQLQNCRGDKGFGDARGTDIGVRREAGPGVDVRVAAVYRTRLVPSRITAMPPARSSAATMLGHRLVDCLEISVGRCGREPEYADAAPITALRTTPRAISRTGRSRPAPGPARTSPG